MIATNRSAFPLLFGLLSIVLVSCTPDENSSGITYQPSIGANKGSLWLVTNHDSRLHELKLSDGVNWVAENHWVVKSRSNKLIDPEGVTKAEWTSPIVYIASEREEEEVSKLGVIAFNTNTSKQVAEWDLTYKLNANAVEFPVGPNRGLEGITWIPDTHLEGKFFDPNRGKPYDPQDYPSHGNGLFVLGLEATEANDENRQEIRKNLYIFALHEGGGSFDKIASFESGLKSVMGLEYDRDTGYLWVHCDDFCENRSNIFLFDPTRRPRGTAQFEPIKGWARPNDLENLNFEGIAVFPDKDCVEGEKKFVWANDSASEKEALVNLEIPCGKFAD